jgi:TatD DNase family protein
MIDIGVNLTHPSLLENLNENIEQWHTAGVSNVIAIASDINESLKLAGITQAHPSIYHTVGCHPHHADSWDHTSDSILRNLITESKNAVAIGETGLDFNRNYSTQNNQINAFNEQISIAKSLDLPLYLHERDAEAQMLSILKSHFNEEIKGVLHCFTANKDTLKHYLDLGLYIGITGWICDERRGSELQEAIKYIPKNRILIETDSPYLLPRSLRPRPKKNHPKLLPHIASQAASYAAIEEAELIKITIQNTKQLFNLAQIL